MPQVVIPDMSVAEKAGQGMPAPVNLLTMGQQALGIRGQQLQNQNIGNQLLGFQAKQAAGRDFQASIGPDGQLDQAGLNRRLANDPNAALAAPGMSQEGLQNLTAQLQARGIDQHNAIQRLQWAGNAGGALLLQPGGPTQAGVRSMMADGVKDGIFTAKEAAQTLAGLPPDGPQLTAWVKAHFAAAQQGLQALLPHVSLASNGKYTFGFNTNPAGGPMGAMPGTAVPNQLAPGQQQTMTTDVNGNPVIEQRDAQGNIVGFKPTPGGAPPQMSLPAGETQASYQQLLQFRNDTNQQAANVPVILDTSNQIVRAAQELQATGKLGQDVARLSSQVGYAVGDNAATALQKLGHFAAMQTASLQKTMGLTGSVAGLGTAEQLAGKTDFTPQALESIAQTNSALASGLQVFNKGMEAAIQSRGDGAIRQFRNAWTQDFSVDAMRLYNAVQADGGKLGANYEAAKKSMGTAAFNAARARAAKLAQLSEGVIPQ